MSAPTPDPLDVLKYGVLNTRAQLELLVDDVAGADYTDPGPVVDRVCARIEELREELRHLLAPLVDGTDSAHTYSDGSRVVTTSDPMPGWTVELHHLPPAWPTQGLAR